MPLTHTEGLLAAGPGHSGCRAEQPRSCLSLKVLWGCAPPPASYIPSSAGKASKKPTGAGGGCQGGTKISVKCHEQLILKTGRKFRLLLSQALKFQHKPKQRHLLYPKEYFRNVVNSKLNRNAGLLHGECCNRLTGSTSLSSPAFFQSYLLKNVTSKRTLWLSSGLIRYLVKYHPAVCSEDKEESSDYHAVQFEADICLTLSLNARNGWRRAAERSRSWARLLAPDPAAAAGFLRRGSKRNALKGSERLCQMFPVLFQSRKGAFSLRSMQSNFSTL